MYQLRERESVEFRLHEPTTLTSVSNDRLIALIACQGFEERFQQESVVFHPSTTIFNDHTGAYEDVGQGIVWDRNAQAHLVRVHRDLDNAGVAIYKDTADQIPLIRLNLRDRRYDGTPEASSPAYLENLPIPERSRFLGGTNWNYSHDVDTVPPGRQSLEISIVSSDPTKAILPKLLQKETSLAHCSAKELADFIDDPFASIPFDNPTSEALNKWYTMWWQVVQRGLRGKSIPFPGQVSAQGFSGYLNHVVQEVNMIAKEHRFSHISAVPTWVYVLNMFESRGFTFDDSSVEDETRQFMEALQTVCLPGTRRAQERTIGDLPIKNPLTSWLAVVPFVIELVPSFSPTLDMPQQYQHLFDTLVSNLQSALVLPSGKVLTYPLRPDRNIWVSRQVD